MEGVSEKVDQLKSENNNLEAEEKATKEAVINKKQEIEKILRMVE